MSGDASRVQESVNGSTEALANMFSQRCDVPAFLLPNPSGYYKEMNRYPFLMALISLLAVGLMLSPASPMETK